MFWATDLESCSYIHILNCIVHSLWQLQSFVSCLEVFDLFHDDFGTVGEIVSFSLLQQGVQFSHYSFKATICPQKTCFQHLFWKNGMILLLSIHFWVPKSVVSVSDSRPSGGTL